MRSSALEGRGRKAERPQGRPGVSKKDGDGAPEKAGEGGGEKPCRTQREGGGCPALPAGPPGRFLSFLDAWLDRMSQPPLQLYTAM